MTNEVKPTGRRTRVQHAGASSILHSGAGAQGVVASSGAHLYSLAILEAFGPEIDASRLDAITAAMAAKIESLKRGDISDIEERLYAQIVFLDTLVHSLAVTAAQAGGEAHAALYWGLVLKAQAASAKTAATLAVIVRQKEMRAPPQEKAIN